MKIESTDIFLFLDYETTGFKKPARACQMAMLLSDAKGRSIAEHSFLIKPEGWQVSQFNIDSCGITQEDCENYGISAKAAFCLFKKLAEMATYVVAHNSDFDKSFAHIEAEALGEIVPATPWFCTMKSNTHIGGKWPKLEEALRHFCGRDLGSNAHNATYDVEACRDIFFAMNGVLR